MTDISVIIPTWNREKTLGKAISSALNQTFPPLEVLVCGVNGSPDQKVVESIHDPRIKWIEVNHTGLPATPRNKGIQVSRGEWIAFLDSDDEWLPEKLEKQLEHVNKMKHDAACSDAIRYVPSEGYIGTILKGEVPEKLISFSSLIHSNYVICSSVLIKKAIVEKCSGFPEDRELRALEDYALWLRASMFTSFIFINEALLVYRDEPQTSARAFSPPIWEQRVRILRSFIEWAESTDIGINNKKNLDLAKKLLLRTQVRKFLYNFNKATKQILEPIASKFKSWAKK